MMKNPYEKRQQASQELPAWTAWELTPIVLPFDGHTKNPCVPWRPVPEQRYSVGTWVLDRVNVVRTIVLG